MNERILCVDDDPQVLVGLRRSLRGRFEVETTYQPEVALEWLVDRGPFAVVLCDMRMPAVDGVQVLARAQQVAPEAARVMLTGNADQETAARAVNEGAVFRFLTKPCSPETLIATLDAAVEHHLRLRNEREVLSETLHGAVSMMAELLALMNAGAFSRSLVLRDRATDLARYLGLENAWQLELAALLARVGLATLPAEVREHFESGEPLTSEEHALMGSLPEIGARLVGKIPRLAGVSRILSGARGPRDGVESLQASALEALLELERQELLGRPLEEGWEYCCDAGVVNVALREPIRNWIATSAERLRSAGQTTTSVSLAELRPGMRVELPIETVDGRVVCAAGQFLTHVSLERIRNHARVSHIVEPVHVRLGIQMSFEAA
jgi:CheY-like chemotaxis protein